MTQALELQLIVRAATEAAVKALREVQLETGRVGSSGTDAGRQASSGLGPIGPAAAAAGRKVREAADEIRTIGPAGTGAGAAASAGLDQVQRSAVRAQRSVVENTASIRDQLSQLQTALVGGLAARELVSASDRYSLLQGRLSNVVSGTREFTERSRELFAVAQANGQALEPLVSLYARTAGTIGTLTGNTRDAVRFTDLVSKSFRLSGASSAEAAGATNQLSQALQSGVLRGDEFNSVNEQGSRLVQALADGLGVARGELRGMADAGELTADRILPALLSQIEKINSEAANLPQTVGQSIDRTGNSFLVATDQANGLQLGLTGVKAALDAIASNPNAIAAAIDVGLIVTGTIAISRLVAVLTAGSAAAGGIAVVGRGLVALLGGPVVAAIAAVSAGVLVLNDLFGAKAPPAVKQSVDAVDELVASYERLSKAQDAATRSPLNPTQSDGIRAAGARVAQLNRALEAARATPGVKENDPTIVALRDEIARLTAVIQGVATAANERAAAPANTALKTFNDKFETEAERTARSLADYRRLVREAGQQEDPALIARIIEAGQKKTTVSTREANAELREQADRLRDLDSAARTSAAAGLSRANSLVQGVLTPVERFRAQIAELNTLVRNGDLERAAAREGIDPTELQNRIIQSFAPASQAPVDDAKESISDLVVFAEQGARNIQDAFAQFLFDPLEGGLKGFLVSFTNTLRQAAAQAAASGILKALFGGLSGSSNGILSAIGKTFSGVSSGGGGGGGIPSAFTGGGFGSGDGFSAGGLVRGPGTPTSDSILARLSDGEFVVRASAVRRLGVGFLNGLNRDSAPGFASGGLVQTSGAAPSRSGVGGASGSLARGGDTYDIRVDARNASNPQEMKAAVEAAVRLALATVDRNRSRGLPASG